MKYSKGFSLVEIIVVLALFMLIISVTSGIFVSVVSHQRRILAQEELTGQISYVQEYISRAVRSAVKDSGGDCLTSGGTSYPGYIYLLTHYNVQLGVYEGIKFITKDNNCQEFFVDPADNMLKEIKNVGLDASPLLSGKFNLGYIKFVINGDKQLGGASGSSNVQPRVTFVLDVKSTSPGSPDEAFQTTISQRNLNIP